MGAGLEAAAGVAPDEADEAGGGLFVLAAAQLGEGSFVVAALGGGVGGGHRGRHRSCRGGRRRGRGRLGRRSGGVGVGLELAQAVVEIHVKILLPLDGVGQIVAEDFVLAAQAGDLGLQEFDLIGQLELGAGAGLELADAAVELVAHHVDAQAGFLVVKQAGVGLASREADEQAGHQRGQKAGEHQNSPE